MKLYLSGPMTGLPDHNYPAFHSWAESLRMVGYTVVSPAELHKADPGSWSTCLRVDIKALCDCDGIALMPGWQNSKGANLELHIAHRLDITIMTVEEALAHTKFMTKEQAIVYAGIVGQP